MPEPHAGDTPPTVAYCLRCHHQLDRTAEHCSRCGLQFDPARPETYHRSPMMLRWKFWFPGFALAVVSGVISYAIVIKGGELGWALFVSVPVSMGAILGYATRARIWVAMSLAVVAIGSVATALVMVNLAGLFCGATLSVLFLVPALAGIFFGWLLRVLLRESRWDQRRFLPIVFFLLLPYGTEIVESFLPKRTIVATVTTDLTVHATPEQAWDSIMFYEEVEHDPPLLARLLLPRPLRSEGSKQRVGEIVRCVYDEGHLVKQICERREGKLLAFEVTEQTLFIHDVKLRDGRFEIEPIDGQHTRIRLTTRYEKLIGPSWMWTPVERSVIHSLHNHVLEGMRRRAEQLPPEEEPYVPQPPHTPRRRIEAARLER